MTKSDETYKQARARHLLTAGFLSALESNCVPEMAMKIAEQAFARFMIKNYESLLAGHGRAVRSVLAVSGLIMKKPPLLKTI